MLALELETRIRITITLSQEGADTIRNTLIQFGVDESHIIAVGLGSNNPRYVYRVGYEGSIASETI